MPFNRTFLLLAIALAAPLSFTPSAAAQSLRYGSDQFSDTSEHWAALCIEGVGADGLMRGYPDGSFRPDATISRAEFAAVAIKAFVNTPVVRAEPTFSDVSADDWAQEAIAIAYRKGFLSGYPGNLFKPTQPITRAQATIIVANALGLSEDVAALTDSKTTLQRYFEDAADIPDYAKGAVAIAAKEGIAVSYPQANRLRPKDNITRGEAAALLCRRHPDKAEASDDDSVDARHYVPAQYVAGWDEQSDRVGPAADNEIQEFSDVRIAGLLHTTAVLGEQLFFFFEAGEQGSQMWASDGTKAGTQQVKILKEASENDASAVESGAGVQHPEVVAVSDTRFWMSVSRFSQNLSAGPVDGLWVSDGTPEGTRPIQSLNPELAQAFKAARSIEAGSSDTLFNGRLPFAVIAENETQIWLTDGATSAGTQRLVTIDNPYRVPLSLFMPTKDHLFFQVPIEGGGMRLWRSDGTPAGTQPLRDIVTDENRYQPNLLATIGDRLITLVNAAGDLSLWESSDTLELTREVEQLNPESFRSLNGNFSSEFNPPISQLYQDQLLVNPLVYRMFRGGGSYEQMLYELWTSDGTEEGTTQLSTTRVSDEGFTAFDGRLFFSGGSINGQELWVTDGTFSGTRQVLDLTPATRDYPDPCLRSPERAGNEQICRPTSSIKSTEVRSLTAHGDYLYFVARDGDIYRTDGTVQGTQHVYRFNGWPYHDFPASIAKVGDKLLVMAYEGDELKLWALPE